MSNYAVRAEGLSKRYHIEAAQRRRWKQTRVFDSALAALRQLTDGFRRRRRREDAGILWAIKDLSFEVRHGDPVGIIGSNGAGKTTLLKILSRITAPTEGKARMRGRVGSLLEVGTGFHSELTGRENVYLNGAVLGMRRQEIARKFDAIVDFSGVEEFIETPLKFYSSGMRMRLAFSVAAYLEPEILLVDEVLAVGDIAFQNKCLNKMQEVTTEGRTVLFVSHNLGAVRALCPQTMYLEHGHLRYMGDTAEALDQYLQSREIAETEAVPEQDTTESKVLSVGTFDADGVATRSFAHDRPVHVRLRLHVVIGGFKPHAKLKVYSSSMETVLVTHDFEPSGDSLLPADTGTYEFEVTIPPGLLAPGKYYLGVEMARLMRSRHIRTISRMDHVGEFDVYDNGSLLSRMNIPWQGVVQSQDVRWIRLDGGATSTPRPPAG